MSSAPPPSGPLPWTPSGYRPPATPRPVRYRPSGWWLALGTGLVAVAIAVAAGIAIWLVASFLLDFDATIDADGRPHTVTVGTDRDRMLWMDSTGQACRVVDLATGRQIPLHHVGGAFSRAEDNGDFQGFQRFDPGSGHLVITCLQTDGSPPGSVAVGAVPRIGPIVAGAVVAGSVLLLLVPAGLVIIIVTGVLMSLRPPRPPGA